MALVRLAASAGSRSWDAVAPLDVHTLVTYLDNPMASKSKSKSKKTLFKVGQSETI